MDEVLRDGTTSDRDLVNLAALVAGQLGKLCVCGWLVNLVVWLDGWLAWSGSLFGALGPSAVWFLSKAMVTLFICTWNKTIV